MEVVKWKMRRKGKKNEKKKKGFGLACGFDLA